MQEFKMQVDRVSVARKKKNKIISPDENKIGLSRSCPQLADGSCSMLILWSN